MLDRVIDCIDWMHVIHVKAYVLASVVARACRPSVRVISARERERFWRIISSKSSPSSEVISVLACLLASDCLDCLAGRLAGLERETKIG